MIENRGLSFRVKGHMDIAREVRKFILERFYIADPSTLSDDLSLLEHGVIDSTGVLEVIAFIESRFGVAVQDDEMLPDNLDSVARIAAFVGRKLSATSAAP